MTIAQLNDFMKLCNEKMIIRYVTPTIHAHFKIVTAVTIHTSYESKEFTITNNSDEKFVLYDEIVKYVKNL